MSEPKPLPRLVFVASESGKITFRIDLPALPEASMKELLDARDWLIGLAGTPAAPGFDVAPVDEEIARRPFDPHGAEDVECAAEDVVREMLMERVVDFAPRHLLHYLLAHDEVIALARAVAERDDVPPLLRQRAACALEALGSDR